MEAMHHQGTPFGEMIHEERVGRGVSIARAAKQAGVGAGVWRRWEAGSDQPTKAQLRRAFGEHCQLQHYLPARASEAPPSGAPSASAPATSSPSARTPFEATAAAPPPPAMPSSPPTTFGDHLQRLREAGALTLEELAELVDVPPMLVGLWESDATAPLPTQHTALVALMPDLLDGPQPQTVQPRRRAPAQVTELHDPLGALDRVVRALEALGQSVVQTYFMPGADGAWEFVVRPNDDPPLAVGVRACDPAVVRHALVALRAGMATRHAQAERLVSAASARLEVLAGTLAAIDGALLAA